ncbi:MAG: DUF6144 family protein [Marinifilaceae bacterium]|jgi:predicted ArsR family transcriptional regulator|nr:DUF6144 family protein [Marinifilaceae bacterium]
MTEDKRITNWINHNLTELGKLNDYNAIKILKNCGNNCCENSELYKTVCDIKTNNSSEKDIDILFKHLKKSYFQPNNITKKGNTINLIFESCTCPMAKKGVNNPLLCNCTIGYSEKIFETLFGRELSINLKKSILNGDRYCEQEIIIQK